MAKIKMNDYLRGRNEGMQFALRIAKERGIEALENEAKFRQVTNLPSDIKMESARKAFTQIRENTADLVMAMTLATLRDEFGFGAKRLQRYIERFEGKMDCINEDYVTWVDIVDNIEEETGVKLSINALDRA